MQLLIVNLNIPMYWGIRSEDPSYFPLNCIPSWSVVNPILYERISHQLNKVDHGIAGKPTFIVESRFHIITKGLVLALTDTTYDFKWGNASFEWHDILISLIEYFRYASKQFSLKPDISSFGPTQLAELPEPLFPTLGDECATQSWHIVTALTKEAVEMVSRSVLSEPPPAYDNMLLDAMEATMRGDYRTAVLLSALSIENLARWKLERAVRKLSNKSKKSLRSAKIKALLHELPLRYLGKSLFYDNRNLHDKALNIYRKRNDIVHAGALNDKTDSSALRLASDAIQCAIQLTEWFGEPGGYASPLDKKTGMIFCNRCQYPALSD